MFHALDPGNNAAPKVELSTYNVIFEHQAFGRPLWLRVRRPQLVIEIFQGPVQWCFLRFGLFEFSPRRRHSQYHGGIISDKLADRGN